eukprot:m.49558 g.49558  ORF g.49558 m.49558 type:complete len:1253 (+) comp7458_c0_seq1:131-3889(+)
MDRRSRKVFPTSPERRSYISELFHAVVSEKGGNGKSMPHTDDVSWVKVTSCCGDTSNEEGVYSILGYANGGQVWQLHDDNVAEEKVSFRGGRLLCADIIPYIKSDRTHDLFHGARPILAYCTTETQSRTTSVIQFISLVSKRQHGEEVEVRGTPLAMTANKSVLAVMLHGEIIVFATTNGVTKLFSLDDVAPVPTFCHPNAAMALGSRWFAYATCSRSASSLVMAPASSRNRSGSKRDNTNALNSPLNTATSSTSSSTSSLHTRDTMQAMYTFAQTTGSTIMHLSDKGYRAVSGLVSGRREPTHHKRKEEVPVGSDGFVAVIDVMATRKDMHTLCHLHNPGDAISCVAFSSSETLLAVADISGQNIHIYVLEPYAERTTKLLYVLQRGLTHAIVNSINFNIDDRWVTVATQRGTIHVFPVHPTGQEISVQTHVPIHVPNTSSFFLSSGAAEYTRGKQMKPTNIRASMKIRCIAADTDKSKRTLEEEEEEDKDYYASNVLSVYFRSKQYPPATPHSRSNILVLTNEGKLTEFEICVNAEQREASYESWGSSVNRTAHSFVGQLVDGVNTFWSPKDGGNANNSNNGSNNSKPLQHPSSQQTALFSSSSSSHPMRVQQCKLSVSAAAVNEWNVCRKEQWPDTAHLTSINGDTDGKPVHKSPNEGRRQVGGRGTHKRGLRHNDGNDSSDYDDDNDNESDDFDGDEDDFKDASDVGDNSGKNGEGSMGQYSEVSVDTVASLIYGNHDQHERHMDGNVTPINDDGDERAWLAEVEMCTHLAPHRRLWNGPQFSVHVYCGEEEEFDFKSTKEHGNEIEHPSSLHMKSNDIHFVPLVLRQQGTKNAGTHFMGEEAMNELLQAMEDPWTDEEEDDGDTSDISTNTKVNQKQPSERLQQQQHQKQQFQQKQQQLHEQQKKQLHLQQQQLQQLHLQQQQLQQQQLQQQKQQEQQQSQPQHSNSKATFHDEQSSAYLHSTPPSILSLEEGQVFQQQHQHTRPTKKEEGILFHIGSIHDNNLVNDDTTLSDMEGAEGYDEDVDNFDYGLIRVEDEKDEERTNPNHSDPTYEVGDKGINEMVLDDQHEERAPRNSLGVHITVTQPSTHELATIENNNHNKMEGVSLASTPDSYTTATSSSPPSSMADVDGLLSRSASNSQQQQVKFSSKAHLDVDTTKSKKKKKKKKKKSQAKPSKSNDSSLSASPHTFLDDDDDAILKANNNCKRTGLALALGEEPEEEVHRVYSNVSLGGLVSHEHDDEFDNLF